MHFWNSNFKHKMKKLQVPQKIVYGKFYVHEKIVRTRNCRCKFIKTSIAIALNLVITTH